MNAEERAAARARCEAATGGKWLPREARDEWIAHDVVAGENADRPKARIAIGMGDWESEVRDNFNFIAAARTDLPAALDDLDAKDAEIGRLRKLLLRWLQVPIFDPATCDETMAALEGRD